MAGYSYVCAKDHWTSATWPIGTAPRTDTCPVCRGETRLAIGHQVQVAPSALETKGGDARAGNAREREWNADMPAYKRMVDRGLQPERIDGCATLENEVGSQLEIDHYGTMRRHGLTRERLEEYVDTAGQIRAKMRDEARELTSR